MPAPRRTPEKMAQDNLKKHQAVTAKAHKRVTELEAQLTKARAAVAEAERRESYAAQHPDLPAPPPEPVASQPEG
jgi:preprotein translocase subunit Sec63